MGIVIPVYNCEKFVEEAVMSVSNQPCKDLIIVVVDDGSTDSSYILCECIAQKDTRIKVIHQDNAGVSAARNRGIQYCIDVQTEYIAFLDADDVWCKDFYTSELQMELKNNHSELYAFDYFNGDESLKRGRHQEKVVDKCCLNHFGNYFCSYLYKTDIFKAYDVQFPIGIKVQEDVAFFYYYTCCITKSYGIRKNIFVYRSNSGSVSHSKFDATERYFGYVIPAWTWVEYKLKGLGDKIDLVEEKNIEGCETMKKTYLSEYIQVACENGTPVNKIRDAVKTYNVDGYYTLTDMIWVDKDSTKRYLSFHKHPYLFWIVYRVKGIGFSWVRKFRNIPIIKNKRYPSLLDGKV